MTKPNDPLNVPEYFFQHFIDLFQSAGYQPPVALKAGIKKAIATGHVPDEMKYWLEAKHVPMPDEMPLPSKYDPDGKEMWDAKQEDPDDMKKKPEMANAFSVQPFDVEKKNNYGPPEIKVKLMAGEITCLNVEGSDIICITFPEGVHDAELGAMHQSMQKFFPGHKILFLMNGAVLSVVKGKI